MEKKEEKVPDAVAEEEPRPVFLAEFFKLLLGKEKFADVYFVVGKGRKQKRFPAHRLVLAASSPLFEAMLYPPSFEGDNTPNPPSTMEIIVKDTSPKEFQALLECIYTDTTEVDSTNIGPLIAVAKKYQIEKLQVMCAEFMEADVHIDNALDLFQVAPDLLGDDEFGLDFIRENSQEVFESAGILQLRKDRFITLVKDDKLGLDEVDLFKAVQKWGVGRLKAENKENTPENLKAVLADILPHVRFPLMDVGEIASNVASSGLLSQAQLLELYKYVSLEDEKAREATEISFNTTPRVGGGVQVKDTKLVTKEYRKEVLRLFGKGVKRVQLELLYRGSRDGFNASSFHSRCDNKQPTFTIITNEHKFLFGGYTEANWLGSGNYKQDPCWIYSLKNNTEKTIKMLPNQTSNHTYCNASYGPTWGGGHDMHVNNNMQSQSNYSNPNTFRQFDPEFPCTQQYTNTLLCGSNNWRVEEIEVFAVHKK